MTNYREILRLGSLGLNKTQIADACDCSRTTVIAVLRRAEEAGLCYPLPAGLSANASSSPISYHTLRNSLGLTPSSFLNTRLK